VWCLLRIFNCKLIEWVGCNVARCKCVGELLTLLLRRRRQMILRFPGERIPGESITWIERERKKKRIEKNPWDAESNLYRFLPTGIKTADLINSITRKNGWKFLSGSHKFHPIYFFIELILSGLSDTFQKKTLRYKKKKRKGRKNPALRCRSGRWIWRGKISVEYSANFPTIDAGRAQRVKKKEKEREREREGRAK